MENIVMTRNDPNHPSEYLKADEPLYPCTAVETRYRDSCYAMQPQLAIQTQGKDFGGLSELCATVEEDHRPSCYEGIGKAAAGRSIQDNADVARANFAGMVCMLGGDHSARYNCVVGAVTTLIHHYHGDAQAKAFCESLEADLRALCLDRGEAYFHTGKRIEMRGIAILRITDGKIVENWGMPDMFGLMRQPGVVPAPKQTTE